MTGFFIEKIDVNTPDNKNRTVLHYAFLYKYPIGLVALLFKNDVNVNAVDKYGKTPLFYANKMNSSQELKNMLYDRGAHL
jgi:ankyrin repeat protein